MFGVGPSIRVSRSTWPPSLCRLSPVDHGENTSVLDRRRLDREKAVCNSLENPLENRYEVNPDATSTRSPIPSSKASQDFIIQSATKTSGVLNSPNALKLEMEVFGDLTGFCQSPKMDSTNLFQNVADELNTPVYEKALFDYDRQSNSSDLLNVISTEDLNFTYKSELSAFDNVNIEDNLMIINQDSIEFKEGENKNISNVPIDNYMGQPYNINYLVISGQGLNNKESMFNSNNAEDICTSEDKVTPLYKELISDEDEYLPTVHNCSDIFNNDFSNYSNSDDLSTQQYILIDAAPFETPDTSMSPSESSGASSPGLSLKIDNKFKCEGIDTPDVIDTINAIEDEKGFNLFNFLNEENPTNSSLQSFEAAALATTTHLLTLPKSPRKRKHKREDDDEDYEPPLSIKRKVTSHQAAVKIENGGGDEEVCVPARRGRPRKRTLSISSESTTEGGKYREMRDKNNEASRKSRLKRKIKESDIEVEARELEERNTKLKAQVAELEKTCNGYRSSFMKIMLSK